MAEAERQKYAKEVAPTLDRIEALARPALPGEFVQRGDAARETVGLLVKQVVDDGLRDRDSQEPGHGSGHEDPGSA